jgi:hypothetical protein
MAIKPDTISGPCQTKGSAWVGGLVLAMILALGPYPPVQAEPFVRVLKHRVIYYHFADKPILSSFKPLGKGADNRTPNCRPTGHLKVVPAALEPAILSAGRTHKLPPALIKAVIRVESNFNPAATSPKGAQGLMQLMPGTAEQLQVADPYDVQENIRGGSRYLGMMLQKFGFRLPLALAAYNAGPGRVERCQGVPPIRETQRFVREVCSSFLQYSGTSETSK